MDSKTKRYRYANMSCAITLESLFNIDSHKLKRWHKKRHFSHTVEECDTAVKRDYSSLSSRLKEGPSVEVRTQHASRSPTEVV